MYTTRHELINKHTYPTFIVIIVNMMDGYVDADVDDADVDNDDFRRYNLNK